ncbi:MAG: hypothetical protein ACRDRQ_05870 [Pseudonocardiaceae bacterium]
MLVVDLISRIRRALETVHLDPMEFERCAVALLLPVYPGLSAVEGGHDFGRDADIYFPLEVSESTGRRGRLLATTGDARANVSGGLRRMREEGLRVDVVVVVTSRPLLGSQRRGIEELAATEYGIAETVFFARDWLTGRLVEASAWRTRLLGIGGELGALVQRPLSLLEQPLEAPLLVGREDDLARLRSRLDLSRDVILSGRPGAGKTRVCDELGDDVWFLEPAGHDRVIDDLRAHRPRAVVVDDAHHRVEELRLLRRARAEEGLAFSILAVTWPDHVGEIEIVVPRTEVLELPLLERDAMNTLVQAVGVRGLRARQVILTQAGGRPGWALALAAVLLRGDAEEVVSGGALLSHVREFVRRSTQSAVALDVLACVAALGQVSDDETVPLAILIGKPLAEIAELLRHAARNGLLDRVGGGWALQPALAPALIASCFFENPSSRPWSTLTDAFPERRQRLADGMITAATTKTIGAVRTAKCWAGSLPEPVVWDDATWGTVRTYAMLDRDNAAWATSAARRVLATTLPTLKASTGLVFNPSRNAAQQQLVDSARRFLLPEAIRGLLGLSVGDDRPRAQTADHPVRLLTELATLIDPDYGTSIRPRQSVLAATIEWFRSCNDRESWTVGAEVFAGVFSPHASGTWTDPGSPDTVTYSSGVEAPVRLTEIIQLWITDFQPLLRELSDDQDMQRLTVTGLSHFLDTIAKWLRISVRHVPESGRITDEHVVAARRGSYQMLQDLHLYLAAVPGLALRAQRLQDAYDIGDLAPFAVDPQLAAVVAPEPRWTPDYESYTRGRAAALRTVAAQLAALNAAAGVARFMELAGQAQLAGSRDDMHWLAQLVGEHVTDPIAWFEAAQKNDCWLLIDATLKHVLDDTSEDSRVVEIIRKALGQPRLRGTVISTVLVGERLSSTRELVLDALGLEDTGLLEIVILRRDNADPVLHRLLTHPVQAIASTAALYFAVAVEHGPPLPAEWFTHWRKAVLQLRANELGQSARWRLGQLLRHLATADPDLVEEWYVSLLEEQESNCVCFPDFHDDSPNPLTLLPRQHRRRLAVRCANQPCIGDNPLTALVGVDAELATQLLSEGTLTTRDLLEALVGQQGEVLETLGPLLMRHGVFADEIAAAATASTSGGSFGSDLLDAETTIDKFTSLLDQEYPALRAIAAAIVALQQNRLSRVHREQHERRVRGEL